MARKGAAPLTGAIGKRAAAKKAIVEERGELRVQIRTLSTGKTKAVSLDGGRYRIGRTTGDSEALIEIPYHWQPRDYQLPLWKALEGGVKRAAVVWHRRAGKDNTAINWTVREAMRRPGLYWHVLPTYRQGRKIVWDGKTRDGRPFRDYIPPAVIQRSRDDEMCVWLEGGSIYQVIGSDQADTLVGANPFGVVFSEFSLQDPAVWDLVRPILAENGGWALFLYTPRGRNHGYQLLEMAAKTEGWFCQALLNDESASVAELGLPDGVPVGYTHAIPTEAIEADRASGMPEEMIRQEYYVSFRAPLVGSYYADQMATLDRGDLLPDGTKRKRITSVPYDASRPVVTAWDLGVGDATAIWFMQEIGQEIHAIDYYESVGKGIDHYADVLLKRPYVYADHLVPHDAKAREFSSGGKSRVEIARNFGLRMRVVPLHRLEDGIAAVRGLLSRCWFDEARCARGLQSLREYRKRWDEVNRIYSDTPLHNWASHGADAFRYFAMGRRAPMPVPKDRAPAIAIV